MELEKYDDKTRLSKSSNFEDRFSTYCDFRFVASTITKGTVFGIRVCKPATPGYILAGTHGWHMSITGFTPMETPCSEYLLVDVDMRGRAFSTGVPDCNGLELYDIYDAINFVKREYKDYILDPDVLYFESASGGGGNALAIAGKFPDLFSAVNALAPIADYEYWYRHDRINEFTDELDVWIGCTPDENKEAYASRSGITLVNNLMTSLLICHGERDERCGIQMSKNYILKAKQADKADNVKLLALHGVGDRDHFGKATPRQMSLMLKRCRENLENHRDVHFLPNEGTLTVAGYVVTKNFEIFTDPNSVVTIHYDIKCKKITYNESNANIQVNWK